MPPPPRSDQAVPRLAAHVRRRADPVNGRPLLLYPEGVLELEETAAAILDLCDGKRTVAEIVAALAESYDAPAEEIAGDVRSYLEQLAARGFISIEEPAS